MTKYEWSIQLPTKQGLHFRLRQRLRLSFFPFTSRLSHRIHFLLQLFFPTKTKSLNIHLLLLSSLGRKSRPSCLHFFTLIIINGVAKSDSIFENPLTRFQSFQEHRKAVRHRFPLLSHHGDPLLRRLRSNHLLFVYQHLLSVSHSQRTTHRSILGCNRRHEWVIKHTSITVQIPAWRTCRSDLAMGWSIRRLSMI